VPDYGRDLEFGLSLVPAAEDLERIHEAAHLADEAGLELIGIQDHPYQRRFLDTWSLIADMLARTDRIGMFPDVANLPLRPPAIMANAAASLDLMSGGRFELGLGAGSFWDGVAAMGGPRRSPGESVDALEEAIRVIRLCWSDEGTVSFDGEHYRLEGYKPGPHPAHPIGIWIGSYKPRMLALTGRLADGWVPSLGYMGPEAAGEAAERIDSAARDAGRDPAEIRRLYNVSGRITDGDRGEGPLDGPVDHWAETLSRWATELGLDTFVFWPGEASREQIERFASDVAPAVRREVERARSGDPAPS
jgi:alkanesulfonate monooxygenase SsuD/methylene tetrahydromethanopterin reductase-like flavin-dependent oxidoreductase (luciferase family)